MLVSLASEMSYNIKACNFGSARNISTYPYICQVWLKKILKMHYLFLFLLVFVLVFLIIHCMEGICQMLDSELSKGISIKKKTFKRR